MLKILIPFLFCNLLLGASFNCTKASSNVEKMICADVQLSELDSQMGNLYKKVSQNVNDKKQFLNNQRSWIKDREKCTTSDCISLLTRNRITQLEDLVPNKSINITSDTNKGKLQVGSKDIPFNINIEPAYNEAWNFTYPLITIIALEDNLKIENIKVNKGKCLTILEPNIHISNGMPVVKENTFPLKINEYDTIKARVSQECNVLRIDISTDEYEWILENKKDFFYFN
ncbi:lysozyme inhibitor LprI family protein [Arcobacter sp. CECT 9188]|uniref:lysozyme inhibitor LprI family protein n=1 Tax=Arcobacter sp. CECT 9188 TaxID=2044505 RepID=UPI000DEBC16B|nr:lysozyme inhibitor LprI family protein [Arcobacter sp. CECT 9188]RBQ26357.1 hypothetical protein CRU88_07735 [Arcobacter sp. CECT 9188]